MSEPQYYRLDILRLTVRDLYAWQGGPSRVFFGCVLRKLLRLRSPPAYRFSWALTEVLDIPRPDMKSGDLAASLVSEGMSVGFALVAYLRPPSIGTVEEHAAVLVSVDRRTIAICSATVVEPPVAGVPPRQTSFACVSRLPKGQELVTINTRPFVPMPPFVHAARYPGHGVAEIARRHLERLSEQPVQPFDSSREGILAHCADATQSRIAFLLEKGFLVPASVSEVEALRRERTDAQRGDAG